MAYELSTTMDNWINYVLTNMGVLPTGGSASAAQKTQAEIAFLQAIKSVEASNIYLRNTLTALITITAGNYASAITVAGIRQVVGGILQIDGAPSFTIPIEYVPLNRLGSAGNPASAITPSKFAVVHNAAVGAQPGAVGQSKVVLNTHMPRDGKLAIFYVKALEIQATGSNALVLPSEYARIVSLMVMLDLAGSFGVELGVRQQWHAMLSEAIQLALAAEAGGEPAPVARAAAAMQGSAGAPLFGGFGGTL